MRKPSLKKQIEALADRFVPDIRAAFLASINGVTSRSMLTEIAEAIRLGDLEKAFRATGMSAAAMRPVAAMIEQAFEAGGVTTTDTLPAVTRPEGATIFRFDVRNSRAETWLRDRSSALVTRISDETRTVIQTMMLEGMRDGRNPKSVALDIIGRIDPTTGRRTGGVVGLTDRDAKAVANMRRDLAGLSSNYFNREARDRRFDRIVQRAISSDKPLTSEKIEALTSRYADNLLQLRGETIARTEGIAALNRAQYEAIAQAIDTGAVNRRNVTKKWDATGDLRTRLTHLAMDGRSVDFDEAFVFPDGSRMMFPGDSSMGAHGSEIINCRCRVDYDIDFLADLTDDDIREGLDLPPAPIRPAPVVETVAVRNARLNEEQRNYTLDNGRAQGVEFLSAFDEETGTVFGRNVGTKSNVQFTPEFEAAIADPKRQIIAHHNHPSSNSFSRQDLRVLSDGHGLKGLWAHGHNGTSYYTERGRYPVTDKVWNSATHDVNRAVGAAIKAGETTLAELSQTVNFNHMMMVYLQRRDRLKNYRVEGSETLANAQPLIDTIMKRLGI